MEKLLKKKRTETIETFEGPGARELYRRKEDQDGKVTWEAYNPVYQNWRGAFRQTSELMLELEYKDKYAEED